MSTSSPVPLSPALSLEDCNKPASGRSLANKNVLITGAASGIGALLALTYAEKGAYVTLVDRNVELGRAYASQLHEKGLRVQFVAADVTSWEDQVAAFKATVLFHPDKTLDIVVANAGTAGKPFVAPDEAPVSLDQDPPKPDTAAWEVNTIGISFTAKLAQLYFELPSGKPTATPKSLIFICSITAWIDFPVLAAYTGSKYGARGLFKNIRGVMASRGHRVNLIAPWMFDTPMLTDVRSLFDAVGAPVADTSLMVNPVLLLADDDSINGRAFAVGPQQTIDLCDDAKSQDAGKSIAEIRKDAPEWESKIGAMLKLMGYSGVF